jgi:hypothetical protein
MWMFDNSTPTEDEPTETDEPLTEEERKVLRWRFRQTRALGLSHVEARMAAECGVDVGALRALVASGCPPSLALRITL